MATGSIAGPSSPLPSDLDPDARPGDLRRQALPGRRDGHRYLEPEGSAKARCPSILAAQGHPSARTCARSNVLGLIHARGQPRQHWVQLVTCGGRSATSSMNGRRRSAQAPSMRLERRPTTWGILGCFLRPTAGFQIDSLVVHSPAAQMGRTLAVRLRDSNARLANCLHRR
jgi:hypothetical protein